MTFIYPSVWSSRQETYYIEPLLSQQVTGSVSKSRVQVHRHFVEDKTNPFPGLLSRIQFPKAINKQLWSTRAALKNHWIFKGYVHGTLPSTSSADGFSSEYTADIPVGVFTVKSKVQLNDVIGFIIGLVTIAIYNLNGTYPSLSYPNYLTSLGPTWQLTNLMGFGFCYGTLQLLSPTTFWTGTLVLAGLFIYDIVMVFYTPLMVTVATSLEVPIKLVFPGPKRGSMLGLGDVVLPGIMMALALRFDLYLHYLRKQRTTVNPATTAGVVDKNTIIRAPYVDATGQWGERFWTRAAKAGEKDTVADGARFSKIYFKASLVGYVIGMLTTLVVLNIFNHAQPALLYLVPGVLVSLWGTALVRGELGLMWDYSEDGIWGLEPEAKDEKKERKNGEKEKELSPLQEDMKKKREAEGSEDSTASSTADSGVVVVNGEKKEVKTDDEHKNHVFFFSLESPQAPKAFSSG